MLSFPLSVSKWTLCTSCTVVFGADKPVTFFPILRSHTTSADAYASRALAMCRRAARVFAITETCVLYARS